MCGVVAIWSPAGGLTAADAALPLDTLRHRGPDGRRSWAAADGRLALGQARLAVVDLVTGDQPIVDEQSGCVIAANGEFYGHRRLRAQLRAAGRRLHTGSDSEVGLHLYALHGPDALALLRGEFAFAVADPGRGRLFAARDRFGIKPLFYATVPGGRLVVASEVKALLAAGVPARWDTAAFAGHLQLGLAPDRTLFAGVRQVPPGCYLVADDDGVRVVRYWDLDLPTGAELAAAPVDDGAHVRAVGAAFEEAVRLRTEADVPVCHHLSGGLDSTSVLVASPAATRVAAFTVCFDDPALDESAAARKTAAALGVEHVEVPFAAADVERHLAATVRAGEMVQENAHAVARYLQSAAIRAAGYRVALAGEGGDELFAGYPQSRRDLELSLSAPARAKADAGYAKLLAPGCGPHVASLHRTLGFVPSWILERYAAVTLPVAPLLRASFRAELAGTDSAAPLLAGSAEQLAGRSPYHQSQLLFFRTWLPNYILAAERLDMAHPVEVRLPLLDHELFAVAARTPLAGYAPGGEIKHPLRAAVADRLPDHVRWGPKRPFFAPPVGAHLAGSAWLRDLLGSAAFRDGPFFAPEAVDRLLDRVRTAPRRCGEAEERAMQLVASTAALADTFAMATGT